MPHTVSDGFRTYFETYGAGFPLLLINGLGGDHREWLYQIPAFEPHFRIIVFDNFGSGKSDVPPGPYTTERMADDAVRLLETLNIRQAHVLGVSLGGMIAQEVALRHPDRVERLVLGCTTPGGKLSIRPLEASMAAFQHAGGEDLEADLRRVMPFLYTDAYIEEQAEEIEAFIQRRMEGRMAPSGYFAQMSAVMTHDASARLGQIRAKTMVITGEVDMLVPPVNSLLIAQRIPGAKLVVLPGAPHRLYAESADAFNKEVLEFLES